MAYRAAVIGCGRIGSDLADDPKVTGVVSHAQAYSACPSTDLVAFCDNDTQSLERCGSRWDVEARYLDFATMLEESKPEIVSICTPDSTHYNLIRAALMAPAVKAVFAEKPLALEVTEAQEIVNLAAKRDVVLAVNYSRRFAESHISLWNFLKNDGIGELQSVSGFYTNGIKHNGTHWFDLARYFMGDVESVWSAARPVDSDTDPTLDIALEFLSGATGHLQGCDDNYFSIFEMDILGTTGRIRITDYGQTVQSYKVDESPYDSLDRTLVENGNPPGGFEDVMLRAVDNLVACLENGEEPLCTGSNAVEALKIAAAACESARTGQRVFLGEPVRE